MKYFNVEDTYEAWVEFLSTQQVHDEYPNLKAYKFSEQLVYIDDLKIVFVKKIGGNLMHHRLDGPSIITKYVDDHKTFAIDGGLVSKEEFDKHPDVKMIQKEKNNKNRLKKILESL